MHNMFSQFNRNIISALEEASRSHETGRHPVIKIFFFIGSSIMAKQVVFYSSDCQIIKVQSKVHHMAVFNTQTSDSIE